MEKVELYELKKKFIHERISFILANTRRYRKYKQQRKGVREMDNITTFKKFDLIIELVRRYTELENRQGCKVDFSIEEQKLSVEAVEHSNFVIYHIDVSEMLKEEDPELIIQMILIELKKRRNKTIPPLEKEFK